MKTNGQGQLVAELPWRGAYDAGATYAEDDLATSGGSTWRAVRAIAAGVGAPSEGANWTITAAKGSTGAAGADGAGGPNTTGAWSAATTYAADDLATRLGSTWLALRAVGPTVTPPVEGADWTIFAAKGDTGAAGADASGPTSDGAHAITVTGTQVDVNVDGSTIEVNANALRVKDGGISATKLSAAAALRLIPAVSLGSLTTADATPTAMTFAGGLPSIPEGATAALDVILVGANDGDGNKRFLMSAQVLVRRASGAAVVVGHNYGTPIYDSGGGNLGATTFAVAANGTDVDVILTAPAATPASWSVRVERR